MKVSGQFHTPYSTDPYYVNAKGSADEWQKVQNPPDCVSRRIDKDGSEERMMLPDRDAVRKIARDVEVEVADADSGFGTAHQFNRWMANGK